MPTTTTTVAMRALDGGMNVTSGGNSGANDSNSGGANNCENKKERMKDNNSNSHNGTSSVRLGNNNLPEHDKIKAGTAMATAVGTGQATSTGLNTTAKQQLNEAQNSLPNNQIPKPLSATTMMSTIAPTTITTATSIPNATTPTPQNQQQQPPVAPKSLFQYLVNYLQVTPSQAAALKDSRHVAKELDAALVKSLSMLQELRETLTQCTDDLDAEFTTIRSILTPRQAAKFLVWVSNNGACMHMLNELWSRQYPDPQVKDEGDFLMEHDEEEKKEVGSSGGGDSSSSSNCKN